MSAWANVHKKFDNFINILMPVEAEMDIQEEEEEVKAQAQVKKQAEEQPPVQQQARKVVNGAPAYGGDSVASMSRYDRAASRSREERPKLTVHTTKQQTLTVRIYAPTDFDQVTAIADDLKAGKAAVVNYERIESAEQRRICDFVNGVCYVLDGCAKRISDKIVLYVPEGVDVDEAMSIALPY